MDFPEGEPESGLGTSLGRGIVKRVIYPGKGELPLFEDGTKVIFHYKTSKLDEAETVLEDSRTLGKKKSMELLIGKQFKLEVWEDCLKTMRRDEVAEFTVDKMHLVSYAPVAQKLRDFALDKSGQSQGSHCCGMAQMSEAGLGYPDLDEFMKNPEPLRFTFQILSINSPGQYKKDAWAMNDEEKRAILPILKEEGNKLYQEKEYEKAAEKYAEALGCLENLVLHEKPNSSEYIELDNLRIPFLLNYAQCKLLLGEYYQAIEHCSSVIEKDDSLVKAYFRRGKAHVACWNLDEARKDFKKAKS
ncbi:AH receptor-interacting protein-like [Amphiura filiformis]|uniref:AH receptor-interacting protein-like n=1 Tax=Amphiura filiformis TaxID=82378 RepID=UPI003B223485